VKIPPELDAASVDQFDPREVEGAIRSFTDVLEDLQAAHTGLSARAERMEAELCRANAALEAKVAELEAVLASLPTGVVVRDAEGRIVRTNQAALALLAVEEAQLLGRHDHPGLLGSAAAREPQELVREGGHTSVVVNGYSEVTLPSGEAAGSVEILDDRTELEAMTRRVHQLDKMAALGTMAGGIAHEVRNPMNAVRGFAYLLEEAFEPESVERRWAKLIQEGVDECDAIVTSMLTFAAPERLNLETVDAQELVDEAVAAARRDLSCRGLDKRYEITVEAEPGLTFSADRIKLRQALRNLVANATDVQTDGGVVHVSARRTGSALCLRVHDAGPGIPDDIAGRVCDPFFTTRAEGTGLGLALVHTIARLHGGILEVSRLPGPLGGADISLSIPTDSHPIPPTPDA